jgi:hypothetical protein
MSWVKYSQGQGLCSIVGRGWGKCLGFWGSELGHQLVQFTERETGKGWSCLRAVVCSTKAWSGLSHVKLLNSPVPCGQATLLGPPRAPCAGPSSLSSDLRLCLPFPSGDWHRCQPHRESSSWLGSSPLPKVLLVVSQGARWGPCPLGPYPGLASWPFSGSRGRSRGRSTWEPYRRGCFLGWLRDWGRWLLLSIRVVHLQPLMLSYPLTRLPSSQLLVGVSRV